MSNHRLLNAAVLSSTILLAYLLACTVVIHYTHVDRALLGVPPPGVGMRFGDLWTWLLGTSVLYDRAERRAQRKSRDEFRQERIRIALMDYRAGLGVSLLDGDPDAPAIREAIRREFGET